MRRLLICAAGMILAAGCAGRKSSLLLERQARGPLEEEGAVATSVAWKLEPVLQTQKKGDVEVTVNYASSEYLKHFFSNKKVFGEYAGTNPYYPEYMVFYVKIANRSPKKIRINPAEFVLIDDRGNQYSTVGADYVTAFGEYRKPVSTTTRGLLENASPGYFGVSVPVGKIFAAKPQGQFALLQQSSLQSGYLFPAVVYDGLITFWNPSREAKKLRLLVSNVKTDFDPEDRPQTALEFTFEFDALKNR